MAEAGPDSLAGMTFPAISEALGAARAMASTGVPYVVVLRSDGTLLDGTALTDAVARIDDAVDPAPRNYLVIRELAQPDL